MKEKKEKKEKLKMSRIIKNVFFVIGFAAREDKWMIINFIISQWVFTIGNVLFDTWLLKVVIDMLCDRTATFGQLAGMVLAMFSVLAVSVVVVNWQESALYTKLTKVVGKIQRDFLEKSSRIDLICYDNPKYYDDFVLAASQCDEMFINAITSTAYIGSNVFGVLLSGAVIFTINPIIAIFPVLGFIINIFTRFAITKLEYNYDLEKKKINRKSDYSKRVFYQPEYAKEIKLSGIEGPLRKQFEESIEEERKVAHKYGIKIALLSLVNWIFVFTFLSHFCVTVYLAYLALVKKSIKLGDVASMNNAANTVRNLLDSTNYAIVHFQEVGMFAERFRRFVEYKENIETHVGTEPVPEHGSLEIKNMSYRYDGADAYTLKNINMSIRSGEKIAIVGENGAGKTTLIKLLMRLYDVTDGEIDYGGHDVRSFTTKEYRAKIAAVFQDYQMYAATLGENVVMDELPEELRDKVENALGKADFGGKLAKLPKGIDTELMREFNDDGTILSGGEAQKVAVARMFEKGGLPAISILDEPSSALDPVAEYTLNTNMMANAKDSTIIFISHRLSTTRDADRIYMFAHGEIVEQGTHKELMALGGEYAEMFEKQAHYYKLNLEEAV